MSSSSRSNESETFFNLFIAATLLGTCVAIWTYEPLFTIKPVKLPKYPISDFNVTNLERSSTSSAVIRVDIQVQSRWQCYTTYSESKVYLLSSDGRVIAEVSMPPFEQAKAEALVLKARFVVVGSDYSGAAVVHFEVRVYATVDLGSERKLQVACDGIGVEFDEGKSYGSMLGHLKHCLVHAKRK